jgi:hypothetical protein
MVKRPGKPPLRPLTNRDERDRRRADLKHRPTEPRSPRHLRDEGRTEQPSAEASEGRQIRRSVRHDFKSRLTIRERGSSESRS